MLRNLIAFEWRYHTRQAAFIAGSLLFLALGFALPATSFGADNVAINAPYVVMQSLAFLSLFSVFVAAIFSSNAVLRDPEHGMHEIVYCTPVGRLPFLAGRFAGAFLATLTAVSFSLAGMIAAAFMPWLDPARVAPFDPLRYLWAFGVVTVPNVLFATALLFAIAILTRNALATAAGSVFIYVLYFIVAAMTDSPLMAASRPGAGGGSAAALLDPFGLTAFFDVTRYWTAAAKSARLVPLEGAFLYNRILWIAAAAAIAAFVVTRFSFRIARKSRKAKTDSQPVETFEARVHTAVSPNPVPRFFASWHSAARIELRILRSVPVLLLLILWLCVAASEIYSEVSTTEYGARLYPATALILDALRQPLSILGTVLLIYLGAEIFWREQRYRIAPILDTTPVSGGVMIAAKWTAMAALITAVIAAAIVPGIALQLARGHAHFEPLAYLSLFWFAGLPLVLFAAAVLFVNSISPGKYAGMLLVLLVALFPRIAAMLGLEHPLWRFAGAPPVRYSDMNGFGRDPVAFHWYMLHWTIVSAFGIAVAAAVWRRVGSPINERLRAAARRWWLLVPVALSAALLFAATEFRSSRALNDWKADYEKTWQHDEKLPQPRITAVTANVELFPKEQRYRVAGHYDLVNRTNAPMNTVLVSVRRDARKAIVSMPSARAIRDDRFGMIRFELAQPLAPEARTRLDFDLEFAKRGLGEPDDTVVENGSLVMSFRCFPGLGYRTSYELRDPKERRKRGLAGSGEPLLPQEGPGDESAAELDRVDVATTISTAEDQIALAPGHLEQTWTRNGRRWFRYRTDAPIFNRFAFASARYEVAKRRHRGVDVEVYHHADHRENAGRVLDTAVAALDYCQTNFGPYPSRQLRLAEVPSYWSFGGFAMPDTIFLVESRTYLIDARDPDRIDLLGRRVAHEVAHEWWGHQLAPSDAEGATLLVESLTRYTDAMLLERLHGPEHARRLLELELDRYLAGRAREEDAEPPLYKVGDQDYVYYSKGVLALFAIRDRIGETRLNLALRNLLTEFANRGGRATSLDLLRHLHTASPADAPFIDEWMKEIILYDFAIESATTTTRPDGRHAVTLRIRATKRRADGRGNETPVAFREPIDIALGAQNQRVVLRDGVNTLTFVVDRAPDTAVIDPNYSRIDTQRGNNNSFFKMTWRSAQI